MKRLLAIALLMVGVCLLAGCGTMASLTGNASYDYEKETADGDKCSLNVNSGRTVGGAVGLEIDENCGLKVTAEKVGQGNGIDLDSILGKVIQLRDGPPATPAVAPSPSPDVFPLPPDG